VLALFGYKYFKANTASNDGRGEIFIIAHWNKYDEIRVNNQVELFMLTDYLYLLI
jgi:hypothetical protein